MKIFHLSDEHGAAGEFFFFNPTRCRSAPGAARDGSSTLAVSWITATHRAAQAPAHPRPTTPNKTGTPILKNLLFEDCDFVTGDLGFAAAMSGLQEAPVKNLCAATARPPHPRWLCAVAVLVGAVSPARPRGVLKRE